MGIYHVTGPGSGHVGWVARQMMLIEAEAKVGAEKGKHSAERKTYFSGAGVRRMDTRLGTIYLYIPKLRKGGYVPLALRLPGDRLQEDLLIDMPERTCRKVRRRSRVIGVFPTIESWVRSVTCYLVEYSEDRGIDRSYIRRDKIQEALERNQAFLMAQVAN